ncbi:MAG: hypothetical protein NTU49_08100, partial [Gammaproteobacteria bacterium]|nr:hypothetical protein [Gammaproteobacteria bacterium]
TERHLIGTINLQDLTKLSHVYDLLNLKKITPDEALKYGLFLLEFMPQIISNKIEIQIIKDAVDRNNDGYPSDLYKMREYLLFIQDGERTVAQVKHPNERTQAKLAAANESPIKAPDRLRLSLAIEAMANQNEFAEAVKTALNNYIENSSKGFGLWRKLNTDGTKLVNTMLSDLTNAMQEEKRGVAQKIARAILYDGCEIKEGKLITKNERAKCLLATFSEKGLTPSNELAGLALPEAKSTSAERSRSPGK